METLLKLTAPAEGLEPPSSWFEARCLSVRPRGHGVPGEIRTRASCLRTRPPGPLVRRGHGELGGTRTLFRRFAANVPRLRTSSTVRPAGVEPALPAWHAGVHPVTPRPQTTFRHAVVESNHGVTNLEFVWAPCPPAYQAPRTGIEPVTGDRQSPCLPSGITRQSGSKLRQSALPRGDGGR